MTDHPTRVSPAKGRTVRDPESRQPIAAGHKIASWSPYWARRLADGDIVPAKGESR